MQEDTIMSGMQKEFFSEIIIDLPHADIPIDGLNSYLLQGKEQQVIFMSFVNEVSVHEHSHVR